MMPLKRQLPSLQPERFGLVLSPASFWQTSMCSDDELNVKQDVGSSASITCEMVSFTRAKSQAWSLLFGSQVVGATAPVMVRARHFLSPPCIDTSRCPEIFHCCAAAAIPKVQCVIAVGCPGRSGSGCGAGILGARWPAVSIATRRVPCTPRASWLTSINPLVLRIASDAAGSAVTSDPMISG